MDFEKATTQTLNLVKKVLKDYHQRLDGAKIAVVMRSKAHKVKGKTILATASKPQSSLRPLLEKEYDFVVTIASDSWESLDDKQKDALIDHELCHCTFDGGHAGIRPHDYEEFAEIIERHGFWRKDDAEEEIQLAFRSTDINVEVGTIN